MDAELDVVLDQPEEKDRQGPRNNMGPPQLPLVGLERDQDPYTRHLRSSDSLDIIGIGNQFSLADPSCDRPGTSLRETNLAGLRSSARVSAGALSDITRPSSYLGRPRNHSSSEVPPLLTPGSTVYNADIASLRTPIRFRNLPEVQIPTSYASSIRSYQYARSDRTGFYTASQYGDAVAEDSPSCASGESQFFSSPGQENEYYGTQILEGDGSEKHEQTSAQAEETPSHRKLYRGTFRQQMRAQDIFMSLKSILGFVWLSKTLKMAMRPSIPAHSTRITWQCECGEDMYADMSDADPSAVQTLSDALNNGSPQGRPGAHPYSGFRVPYPAHMRNGSNAHQPTNSLTNHPNLSNTNDHGILAGIISSTPPPSFLELCINTGNSCQSLGEVEVSLLTSDTMLFEKVRQRYRQVRGSRIRKHFMLKPTAIEFVSFGLEKRRKVHIFNEPSLPSADDVAAATWHYDPCPPNPPPLPMPSSAFIHYLTQCTAEPDPFGKAVWLSRLPKKLNESLFKTTEDLAMAWGIHIIEGPNPVRIMWTIFGILVICVGPLLAYAVVKQDIQGATGIMSTYIAVMTTVMTAMIFFQQKEG